MLPDKFRSKGLGNASGQGMGRSVRRNYWPVRKATEVPSLDQQSLDVFDRTRLEEFHQRCAAFDRFLANSRAGYNKRTCPACGFPSLDTRRNSQTCVVCLWEDCGLDGAQERMIWAPNYVSLLDMRNAVVAHLRNFFNSHRVDRSNEQIVQALQTYTLAVREVTAILFEDPYARWRACFPRLPHPSGRPRFFRPYRAWRQAHPLQCAHAEVGRHPMGTEVTSWVGAKCRNCRFLDRETQAHWWSDTALTVKVRCGRHGRQNDRGNAVHARWPGCVNWLPQAQLNDEPSRIAAFRKLVGERFCQPVLNDATVTALDAFDVIEGHLGSDAGGYWLAWARQVLGEARSTHDDPAAALVEAAKAVRESLP